MFDLNIVIVLINYYIENLLFIKSIVYFSFIDIFVSC